jgi:hypothetical protein
MCKNLNVKSKFIIEKLADECGKEVKILWLPPAHCEFNSIELIWSVVKGYIGKHNNSKNLNEILALSHEAIKHVTPIIWKNCIHHAKKYEDKMRDRDLIVDDNIDLLQQQQIIIPLGQDSTSESDDTGESDYDLSDLDL